MKKSVKTNVVSVAISRSAGSVGKAIGRRFSKASHNSITKAAKKSHSTSKSKRKSSRIKTKASSVKKRAVSFFKKHSSNIRGNVSSFAANCVVKWKKVRNNVKRKWGQFWRRVRA